MWENREGYLNELRKKEDEYYSKKLTLDNKEVLGYHQCLPVPKSNISIAVSHVKEHYTDYKSQIVQESEHPKSELVSEEVEQNNQPKAKKWAEINRIPS